MSNLGLHLAMRRPASTLRTTEVGDRYVLEELRAGGYSLGGEQSGHIVLPAFATTGDGIVTGLRLMSRMAQTGMPRRPRRLVTVLPQVLINVQVTDKAPSPRRPRSSRPWPSPRRASATPAEFCCGPREPNSWSG